MKDERAHHGAIDKSYLEQQICVSALTFCILWKNWPYPPTSSGTYGRQACRNAGQETKYGQVSKFLKFSLGQTIWAFILFKITAMLLQYQNFLPFGYYQLKLIIIKMCFEVQNIWLQFLNQVHAWFLKIKPVRIVCMCVCVCVCPPPRLLITSDVMWHDIDSIRLVKQVLQLLYGNCSRYR